MIEAKFDNSFCSGTLYSTSKELLNEALIQIQSLNGFGQIECYLVELEAQEKFQFKITQKNKNIFQKEEKQ